MATSQKLLSNTQLKQLTAIAASDLPHKNHATALIELHNGATHAMAAATAGLTTHQVQYWLKKFRTNGLEAFPSEPTPEIAAAEEGAESSKKSAKKDKKTKDKKQSKDAKKKSKKKDKKSKKDAAKKADKDKNKKDKKKAKAKKKSK